MITQRAIQSASVILYCAVSLPRRNWRGATWIMVTRHVIHDVEDAQTTSCN